MYLKTVSFIFLTTLSFSLLALSERELASHKAFKAFILDNEKCKETMPIIVRSSTKDDFSKKYTQLQRLIAGIRISFGFECEKTTSFIISGQFNGQEVYRGVSSKDGDWALINLPITTVAKQKKPSLVNKQVALNKELPTKVVEKINQVPKANQIVATSSDRENKPVPNPFSRFQTSSKKEKGTGADNVTKQGSVFDRFKKSSSITKESNKKGRKTYQKRNVGISLSNYDYSGAISALYTGNFSFIPDDKETRKYVYSIYKKFNEFCSKSPSNVGMNALKYVDPKFRKRMVNPAQGGWDLLIKDVLPAYAGGMQGLMDARKKNALLLVEGLNDGALFIERNGCYSKSSKKLRSNIFTLILARYNKNPIRYDFEKIKPLLSKNYKELHNIKGSGTPTNSSKAKEAGVPLNKSRISLFTGGSAYWQLRNEPKNKRDLLMSKIQVLEDRKLRTIACEYGPKDAINKTGYITVEFWYDKAPDNIDTLFRNKDTKSVLEYLGKKGVDKCPNRLMKAYKLLKYNLS